MRHPTLALLLTLVPGALIGAPFDPEDYTPAAMRARIERQVPAQGVPEIREPLRELKTLRKMLLERSNGSRFAFGGHIELLLFDTNELLENTLAGIRRYRELVQELRAVPIAEYLRDPGTQWALERAVAFGERTALAIPRIHRLGYLRIQPILDGPLVESRPRIFGDRPPESAIRTR